MTEDYQGLTPPPELVEQIRSDALHKSGYRLDYVLRLIHAAYRAGDDLRLEACVEWLTSNNNPRWALALQEAMRPKPPSLAEQALAQTNAILNDPSRALLTEVRETLELNRVALNRLQELEGGNG